MDVEMVTVVRAIEALPVVTILSPLAASSKNKPRFRVGFRCFSCQEYGSCEQQQAGPVRITNTRTTLLACLQELHKQIVDGHGACCVDASRVADESDTSRSSTADACLACGAPTHFATRACMVRPPTLLREHTAAGVTRVRACAGDGMGQSLLGGGP